MFCDADLKEGLAGVSGANSEHNTSCHTSVDSQGKEGEEVVDDNNREEEAERKKEEQEEREMKEKRSGEDTR